MTNLLILTIGLITVLLGLVAIYFSGKYWHEVKWAWREQVDKIRNG